MAAFICCFMHFLIIICAIPLACSVSSSSIENDKIALLSLRDGLAHGVALPGDSYLNSWNSSRHVCHWQGIACGRRHKRVTEINLSTQKLNGVLSPSIGNLSFLRVLDLEKNSLHGEIPKQMGNLHRLEYLNLIDNSFHGHIPVELSNCSALESLDLGFNKLIGPIPFQLGVLSKITVISLTGNKLVGEMPNFLTNFTLLTILYIAHNNLHGEIGDSLQGLSKLEFLSLGGNSFTGTIPPSLYNLSSLEVLDLSENKFTGMVAQEIDVAFPRLENLSLRDNGFTGNIPLTLSNISGLSYIDMGVNKFTGSVPDNLGNLKNLWALNIYRNRLGGGEKSNDLRFIDSLTNCSKLKWLDLTKNIFVGPIPNSVGNLSYNLGGLKMFGNHITGPIPEAIGKLYGLNRLDFSDNMLTGIIPDTIGELSNISGLFLSNNNLHGEIPSSMGNLTKLCALGLDGNLLYGIIPKTLRSCKSMEVIDISSNHFGGNLPGDVFGQFKNLYFCDLSYNSFDGSFPLEFGQLRSLNFLDASYNNFIGEIPAQLGESLVILSLAGNSFQGNIPASLGGLGGLSLLDLSSNNLSGPIPKELASLVLIQNLNLSFNQLEGKVPLFKNVTGVSVLGNSKLCGGNPELHINPCALERTGKTISDKVKIAAAISSVALLSLLVLVFIFFCCQRKHTKENADGLAERYRRVTYLELFKATDGFAESNLIGTGSFGDVFKGNLDGDETKPVAVKVLKLSEHGATKSFIAECRVLRRIRHRNLLRIITSCSSLDQKGNDFKALVFDFMSNGNLDSWLHVNQHQEARCPLTLAERLQIALEVGCALNYLHDCCEPPIVHCDLKPSNILLDDDMVAHVGDFGLAKLLYGLTENMSGGESLSAAIRGTIGYVAPEYGMGATISPHGDTYSYGILLLELITGRSPTNGMFSNEMNLRSFIERALPDHIEEVVDECLVDELNEAMTIQTNPEQCKLHWHTFLVSFAEVGISCSAESSKERMDIQSAVKCLMRIKEKLCQVLMQ